MIRTWHSLLSAGLLGLLLCVPPASGQTDSTDAPTSKFRSPDDGWPDVSAFLDDDFGFFPVVIPITEPAVGYGAAFGPDAPAFYIALGSAWMRP